MAKRICDRSGFVGYDHEMTKTWDGLMVLKRFSDGPRHPQDFPAKPRVEKPVRDARPEAEDVFLEPGDVTPSDL